MKWLRTLMAVLGGAALVVAVISDRRSDFGRAQAQERAASQVAGKDFNPYLSNPGINVDPTAYVHPTVILAGKVTIGAYTYVDAGTILTGDVAIGHHTLVRCNVTIRGRNRIGNYVHIYDNVLIEGGRPAKPTGGSAAEVVDESIIGDDCWVNHGATMHGTRIADRGAVGLNAACDYNTRIGAGAILANGSATRVGQVIPDNSFAEGVPAVVKKKNITDKDRVDYFGVHPATWTHYEGDRQEANAKKRMGK